jgi:hypothetical protein
MKVFDYQAGIFTSTIALSLGQIPGTATNDNAATGFVGEYISLGGAGGFNATTVWGDFVNISLTAGDWNLNAMMDITSNGSTWTEADIGISTTSGNSAAGLTIGTNWMNAVWASSAATPVTVPLVITNYRVSLASTTTMYFKYMAVFSAGGPPQSNGALMYARRVR